MTSYMATNHTVPSLTVSSLL